MSVFLKWLAAVLFSLITTFFCIFYRFDRNDTDFHSDRRRYNTFFSAWILPAGYPAIAVVNLVRHGAEQSMFTILSAAFDMSVQMSIYYLALLLIMPGIRKYISSRACAVMWTLPTFLIFTFLFPDFRTVMPKIIVPIPEKTAYFILWIWLVGVVGILTWKIIEHLCFRSHILKDSIPVTDPEMMLVWENEIARARIKSARFEPVISEKVKVPLSIGLSERTTKVVIPKGSFTESELKLIFRHEIIHVCRNDSANKFFMVFCEALCWFNPMMWGALRKCSEDLELSCDETVLLNTDEEVRYEYAELLLDNAESDRGFTSCLSASALAMKHRIKSALSTKKLKKGAMIVFLLILMLFMGSGYIIPAFGKFTGNEILLQSDNTEQCGIRFIKKYSFSDGTEYICRSENEILEYMSGVEMARIADGMNYYPNEDIAQYIIVFDTSAGQVTAAISENYIFLLNQKSGKYEETYYLPKGIDIEYFENMIAPENETE